MSHRKRKLNLIASSDEESAEQNSSKTRHSKRIQQKQQKAKFQLPSRHKIWNTIPSVTSEENLKRLSPRKSVNDFTKVYNTYNYDDYDSSSDDAIENFITDSSGNSDDSGSSDDENLEKAVSPRIKNYHRRLKVESSSDDEDLQKKGTNDANEKNDNCEEKPSAKIPGDAAIEISEINEDIFPHNCQELNGDSDNEVSPYKRRRNISILDSDDDGHGATVEGESEDTPAANADEGSSTHSSNSSSDDSSSEDEDESRSSKLRRRSRHLFQEFKAVQAKRKLSLESHSSSLM